MGGTVGAMRVHIVDHPLVAHKLSVLRDKKTPSMIFRQLTEELVMLLAYEATRDVAMEEVRIETPVTETTGFRLARPRPLVVPILRAGLGMLEGMTKMAPSAEVGFLGMARNEETLDIVTYAERLPADLSGRHVFVLDPMLATGGTLIEAIRFLYQRGAARVTSRPSMLTRPPRAASRPKIVLIVVVLPIPLRPSRVTTCPCPTDRWMSWRTCASP